MPDEGWIKLYRCTLDNPVVCKDSDYFAVWCYLLLMATHKDIDMLFRGKRITLTPGQLLTSRKSISTRLDIHGSKVHRILKTFESEHQIEQQTSNKNRLISIVNWKSYQQDEQQNEQQVNNNRTTSEQQVNTNKNVKNDKNKRIKEKKSIDTLFPEIGEPPEKQKIDYEGIKNYFNQCCVGFPAVREITDRRKTAIKSFLKKHSEADLYNLFDTAQASDFLTGSNDRGWQANFDWIIKPANAIKILEGNYPNKIKKPTTGNKNLDVLAEWAKENGVEGF